MCDFNKYHFREDNKFDRTRIYGDVRIGVVIFTIHEQTYYCVDLLNLQTQEGIHMDCFAFEECIHRLMALAAPDIELPYLPFNSDLTIKQIPLTNTYKVVYCNQRIILDVNAIEGIVDIWRWVNFAQE